MSIRLGMFVVVAGILMGGCSSMEQYHFPQTQDKVPAAVMVAFGDSYPNDTITSITEQKMFDGQKHYKFTITNPKIPERTVAFDEAGKQVENPL